MEKIIISMFENFNSVFNRKVITRRIRCRTAQRIRNIRTQKKELRLMSNTINRMHQRPIDNVGAILRDSIKVIENA